MVDLWPWRVFYRAYFGTMKFKERLAFCICVVLLLVPFILLRFRISNDKRPLMLSVIDSQSLTDGMDFNRIDHSHHIVSRSSESKLLSLAEEKEGDQIDDHHSSIKKNPDDAKKHFVQDNVDDKQRIEEKIVNNDVDYEDDDPWLLWRDMVKSRQITTPDDKDSLNMILEAMAYKPIVAANVGHKGTQLKAMFLLEGAQKVVFKPMR